MNLEVNRFPSDSLVPERYHSVRHKFQTGDILVCAGEGFGSRIIRRATGSLWSHVGMVFVSTDLDRVMLLESVENIGTRCVPLSSYASDYSGSGEPYNGGFVIARHSEIARALSPDSPGEAEAKRRMGQFAVSLLGRQYDESEIFRIGARIAGLMSGEPKKDKLYICSEYVWEIAKSIGVDIPYNEDGYIAPADVVRTDKLEVIAAFS